MVGFRLQKRLAAEILGVGESRIKINAKTEDERTEVESAITREDVRRLIERGIIIVVPEKSNSRGRWRERRKKRRTKGPGKRKGKASARLEPKRAWINRIRKLRAYLKYLRDKGMISKKLYRKYYALAKGGAFSSLASLKLHLEKEIKSSGGSA